MPWPGLPSVRVEIIAVASREAARAAAYLEAERYSAGLVFRRAYAKTLRDIEQRPESFAEAEDSPAEEPVRAALLKKYNYRVLFVRRSDRCLVTAVAHASRRPGYWHARVDEL
jgi:hypothetical protein